jgi:hypothetical protein
VLHSLKVTKNQLVLIVPVEEIINGLIWVKLVLLIINAKNVLHTLKVSKNQLVLIVLVEDIINGLIWVKLEPIIINVKNVG